MHPRLFAAVALPAVGLALLVGCTAETSATPVVAEAVDLCALAAPAGSVSDSVEVAGDVGAAASVSLAAPLAISSTERTVAVEGAGDRIASTDLVHYAFTAYDAATGEQIAQRGYDQAPQLGVSAGSMAQYLGCATVGSRVVVAVPETDLEAASVWVLDVLDAQPGRATGEDQEPVDGMPGVELSDAGVPTIHLPGGEPPAETEVAVLKKGDGAVVAAGDTVMLQYTGARWSNGQVFDSSWTSGAATSLVTTETIPGYREALEGQTVGSQVLAVIPPASAYGEGEINEYDLTGETLVFVIDILETVPTPQ